MVFRKLNIAETAQMTVDAVQNLGQIRVDVHRVTDIKPKATLHVPHVPKNGKHLKTDAIPEKLTKANLSHQAGFVLLRSYPIIAFMT